MALRDRKVRVSVNISALVPVITNDGGYLGRECKLCGACGYERNSDYGYHAETPIQNSYALPNQHLGNDIKHKPDCPLNQYIDKKTGKLKP